MDALAARCRAYAAGVSPPSGFLRSVLVVVPSPVGEDRPRVGEADNPGLVETLVPQPPVAGVDVGVLVGLAGLDQAVFDAAPLGPGAMKARPVNALPLSVRIIDGRPRTAQTASSNRTP